MMALGIAAADKAYMQPESLNAEIAHRDVSSAHVRSQSPPHRMIWPEHFQQLMPNSECYSAKKDIPESQML
jgi:hypothetical protein